MILLTATTHKLTVTAAAAVSLDWSASWVEITSTGFVPGSDQGNVAAASTFDVVGVPSGSSAQRQLKALTLRNAGAAAQTVTLNKDVSGTARKLSADVTLQAGEVLTYIDSLGFAVFDSSGRIKQTGSIQARVPVLLLPGLSHNASLTATKTLTSGTAFAVYIGKAPRSLSSLQVRYNVTTAAATITWAEIALAKGSINVGGNPTLTVVGFADVSAVINSTGRKTTTINVSAGQAVNEGDDLWLICGNAATTAGVLRALSIADDLQVGVQASLASRPSTIVGTPSAFTIEGATTLAAWMVGIA